MAAERPIPVYTNLNDLYQNLGTSLNHAVRWNNLAEQFEMRFGRKPTYIARAPGRVKRPSISQEIGEDKVHAECWDLDINTKELRWESYVKAGYYGVLNHYFSAEDSLESPIPVDLLFTGSVPAGSGLSSSAAMVVASTLAFLAVNAKLDDHATSAHLTKGDLVRMSMENEKRVGVNSGGMDQAASVISDASSALYISFFPILKATPVLLPAGSVFVCANSLVVADKAVGAKRGYNLRVVETLVGARILANALGVAIGEKERVTYREVLGRLLGEEKGEELGIAELQKGLERMVKEVELLRPKGVPENGELGVTMEEMIAMTGLSDAAFHEIYLSWVEVEASYFQLYNRAKHVYSEALRVLQFQQTCLEVTGTAALESLGRLMNESQASCAYLYDCTCPEVDQLAELARKAGAYGSRVTGAGFGGCTVSLVAEDKVQSFIEQIRDTYPPYKGLEGEALSEVIFATSPSSGACVYKM
ncbi:hypothetical protein H0H87_005954 [Tephrocybe sp. NHM501043]|nr:hypothetical protein H0H87_005954 [Tephrocybe sp. NHM501043]